MKTIYTFCLVLFTNSLFAQDKQFSELLDSYSAEQQFNGTVLVATNGNIDFIASRGLADRQNNIPLDTTSKFQVASVTKVFTAVLIMKLVQDKKLNLNDTIGEYLPDFKGEGKDKITLHHLLTYSSGLENKLDGQGMSPYQTRMTLDQFIDEYCSGKLVHNPGEKSAYGNTEYILLHKIIENASDISFESYLQKVIIEPLDLQNTQILKANDQINGLVPNYIYNESSKGFDNEESYYHELYFGSGALYSTVEDLLIFDQALFNNKLLYKPSTKTLLTIHPELGYTAYGLWGSTGWGIFKEPFYYRTGGILGANANWIHTIDSAKTIIVLSNTNATNLYGLSEKLYLVSIADKPLDKSLEKVTSQ